jgi:uncharacterized protein YndB with AHSA1/START domain
LSTLSSQTAAVPDVRKHVRVPVPADRAFEIFADHPLGWWPADHKLVPGRRVRIEFERTPGGRWYEVDADGNLAEWGRVLAWEPHRRLALSWRIDGRWQPIDNDEKASEIVVTFTPDGPDNALVELAHVKLHKHGEWAASIHAALDGPSPGDTLAKFAVLVDQVLAGTVTD